MVRKSYIVEAKVKGTLLVRQEAESPDEALEKTDNQELIKCPDNVVEKDVDIDLVIVEEEKCEKRCMTPDEVVIWKYRNQPVGTEEEKRE